MSRGALELEDVQALATSKYKEIERYIFKKGYNELFAQFAQIQREKLAAYQENMSEEEKKAVLIDGVEDEQIEKGIAQLVSLLKKCNRDALSLKDIWELSKDAKGIVDKFYKYNKAQDEESEWMIRTQKKYLNELVSASDIPDKKDCEKSISLHMTIQDIAFSIEKLFSEILDYSTASFSFDIKRGDYEP